MWKTSDMMNYIQQSIEDIPHILTETKPDENGNTEIFEVETEKKNSKTLLVKITTHNGESNCEDIFVIQCMHLG